MGGATAWDVDDDKKFLEKHGPGTMARRWFYLARNTAGRIGDMNKLEVHNIVLEGGRAFLTWQPAKKGSKPVTLAIMDELAAELADDTGEEATFLRTEYGRPFASSGSLDNKVRDWIVAAKPIGADGKAVRSQHGIRKATAHELAKAGASVFEVAARLSHSDVKSSAPYVKDVERAGLVLSGFERVEKARKAAGVPQPQKGGTLPKGMSLKTILSVGRWQPVGLCKNPCDSNGLGCPTCPERTVEIIGEHPRLSNPDTGAENENPGALSGATGAELHSSGVTDNHTLNRRAAAMALADAAADCPPEIRARLLERLLDTLHPGWPQVPFMATIMEEAQFWADLASRRELKAYALACYRRMDPADRVAFIDYLAGGAA